MSTAVAKINPNLPAAIAKHLATIGEGADRDLSGGVTSGYPVISYRGKVWRIRKGGEENNVVDDEGDAVPSLEVILIKSNPQPSKIFYEKSYEEGGNDAPRCWSADGFRPDLGVQDPICKTCAACPKNVWGSRISESGSKTKACADARRVAVTSKHELEEKGAEAPVYLLRIPPASLNPMKDYAEKVLKPKAIPYFAVITKLGFDAQVAYPKMTFRAKEYLSDEMAEAVISLRDSDDVRRILAESEEFAGAGTSQQSQGSADADEATAGTPATAASKKKSRVVEEEDVGIEDAPAPKKKKAVAPVVDEDEDEDVPPPPKKKKPAPVVEDEDEDEPPPVAAKKKVAAPVVDEDEDEDEAPPPPKKKKPAPVVEDEDEDEVPPPAKKKAAPAAKKKAAVADDEDDTPPPPAAKKKVVAPPPADSDFDSMLSSILGGNA